MTTHDFNRKFLAQKIKKLRVDQGLSQAKLAERAGFARSTLSKIENGILSPTFEILLKIAHGFGLELTEFLHQENEHGLTGRMVVTKGTPETMVDGHTSRLSPLASQLKNPKFQSYVAEFTCSDIEKFGPWNSHPTQDFLFVLSGTLIFHSEGYEKIALESGDSVHFDGKMRHACLTLPAEICRCIYVFAK